MKRGKIFKWVLLLTIVLLLIGFRLGLVFELKPKFNLTLNLGEKYHEPGFVAHIWNQDISSIVETKNNLNSNKIGTYYIYYRLPVLFGKPRLVRKVTVVDNEKPKMNLNGEETLILYLGDSYQELGAQAYDNVDGNLSSQIKTIGVVDSTQKGTYTITYKVKDSSGNQSTIKRRVKVKNDPRQEFDKVQKIIKKIEFKDLNDFNSFITEYLKNNHLKVSIGYYNLVTQQTFYYQENVVYYGASLIKTLDAIYLYEHNLVTPKVEAEIKKAITKSDNRSHFYLINLIGKQKLKNYGIKLGAHHTLEGGDKYGNTTVMDQIVYLKKLYEITKSNKNETLKSFFINDYYNYLKINENQVMHKYGFWNNWFHDVGIVLDEEPYLIVILTEHASMQTLVVNNLAKIMAAYHELVIS